MLTRAEAERELRDAESMNPGPWGDHSRSVAENAFRIARRVPGMDQERAYVLGLMHDIGRRAGVTGIRHIFDGYEYMTALGQPEIACVCLTHSFPVQDAGTFLGKYDCTEEQLRFLTAFLEGRKYDDYDRLIQLCDGISLPGGACIMEKRLVDVSLRHGFPEFTGRKWRAFLQLKKDFDEKCGCCIYDLLPNVLENSGADLF